MTETIPIRVQHKRMTAAQWRSSSIILLAGEIGVESDTGYLKVGDGSRRFSQLAYLTGPKGDKGERGEKGEQGAPGNVSFSNFTESQRAQLKGDAGRSVMSITRYYRTGAANITYTNSHTGWTTSVPNVTTSRPRLWAYDEITYSDGQRQKLPAAIIMQLAQDGSNGAKGDAGARGADGRSVTEIRKYYLTATTTTSVSHNTAGWTTTPPTISSSRPRLWTYDEIIYSDGQTTKTSPVLSGQYGNTGATGARGTNGTSVTAQVVSSLPSSQSSNVLYLVRG